MRPMQSASSPALHIRATPATTCTVPTHLAHMVNPAVLEARARVVAERMNDESLELIRRRRCVAVIGQHILKEIGNARVA